MPIWLQATTSPLPTGYGVSLLQTLLALAAVCVLAWVVLKWGAGRGFALGTRGGRVQVVERVPLDPRRSLYLVKVDDRWLVIGAGESGAPALLKELGEGPGKTFADVVHARREADVTGGDEPT